MVSRDRSIDRSEVPTHAKGIHLLLKFRFRVEFFHFRVSAYTYSEFTM
jgi:hypothetical protein